MLGFKCKTGCSLLNNDKLKGYDLVPCGMLSMLRPPSLTAFASPLTAPSRRAVAPQMMAKSESLPFMEEPAHLSGMIGNVGFDPMGLSTPQNIKWMREAELKHGRMTMLAWAGWVSVDLGMKFPGAKYADLSSYKAALIVDGKSLLDQSVGYEMLLLFLWVGAAARSMQCPSGHFLAHAL